MTIEWLKQLKETEDDTPWFVVSNLHLCTEFAANLAKGVPSVLFPSRRVT